MASKFGGVPVQESQGSRFGGVPVEEELPIFTEEPIQAVVDPTVGGFEDYLAGLGKSFVDVARGGRQAIVEAVSQPLGAIGSVYRALGAPEVERGALGAPARYAEQLRAEETERERLDAPLRARPAGLAGEVTGSVAQLAIPGALLRGTRAGSAFLPRSMIGNALQGMGFGAIQPVGQDESRAANVALGGAAGGVGAAIPAIAGAALRGAGAVAQPLTRAGQERIVANLLRQSATAPERLQAPAASAVPGVQRTLAESVADPGIANLQRQFPVGLADQQAANTAARVGAIRGAFEGADQPSIEAIESAARQDAARVSGQLRGAAGEGFRPAAGAPDLTPVEGLLTKVIDARRGNETVQRPLRRVLDTIRQTPPRDAREAWNVRQFIDRVIEGTAEDQSGKAARRELTLVKSAIDKQMRQVLPEWGQFLSRFKGEMTRADQARVGQRLIEGGAGTRAINPQTGEPILTPANLLEARNPERLVRQATGFPRASAERTLTPQQRSLLSALAEDADRMRFAEAAGRMAGSPTAQNLATQNIIRSLVSPQSRLGQLIGASEPVQRLASLGEKTYGLLGVPQRLQEVTEQALSNPAEAQRILASLPIDDRRIISQALTRIGGFTGVQASQVGD